MLSLLSTLLYTSIVSYLKKKIDFLLTYDKKKIDFLLTYECWMADKAYVGYRLNLHWIDRNNALSMMVILVILTHMNNWCVVIYWWRYLITNSFPCGKWHFYKIIEFSISAVLHLKIPSPIMHGAENLNRGKFSCHCIRCNNLIGVSVISKSWMWIWKVINKPSWILKIRKWIIFLSV